jgi:hypothetical protein
LNRLDVPHQNSSVPGILSETLRRYGSGARHGHDSSMAAVEPPHVDE